MEAIIGGIFGGILRFAPELLKWLDRRGERAHELALQDKMLEFEKLRGQQKMAEITAAADSAWSTGAIQALKEAVAAQGKQTGVKWADAFSSIIRPLITFQWVILLYPAVIVASFWLSVENGVSPLDALANVFGPEEKALVAGILNFWFLGRVFDKALK